MEEKKNKGFLYRAYQRYLMDLNQDAFSKSLKDASKIMQKALDNLEDDNTQFAMQKNIITEVKKVTKEVSSGAINLNTAILMHGYFKGVSLYTDRSIELLSESRLILPKVKKESASEYIKEYINLVPEFLEEK